MVKGHFFAHTNAGDCMNESLWRQDISLPKFPELKENLKTDVLIIGGGLAGLLCAYRLEQDGVNYTLIESNRIMSGTSGYTTAKVTSQHGLIYGKLSRKFGPDVAWKYWQANEEALTKLKMLASDGDCDWEETDNYIYSVDRPETLQQEMQALQEAGIPAKWSSAPKLPFRCGGAIRFSGQAQFHPLKFAAKIAKNLRIYENTRAIAFEGDDILTENARIRAKKIIVATHFPIFNKHGGYFLKQYQQRSYVLALENAGQVGGMYLSNQENGISLRNWGKYLLLGGGGHRTGKKGGAWEELERFAAEYYPQAREVCRWATQDCMTLDGMPYIGQYSRKTPHLFVATGFNKWGMTSSMLSSMILGDLVQEMENPYAELFDPSRSIWHRQLLCNGVESVCHLLTPTAPRCPHLGCALNWNPVERSWDCPCHGSRFSEDGEVLNNPATANMKKHP